MHRERGSYQWRKRGAQRRDDTQGEDPIHREAITGMYTWREEPIHRTAFTYTERAVIHREAIRHTGRQKIHREEPTHREE